MRGLRVLVIDSYAEHALDFCLRAMADGHEVRWFSDPSSSRGIKVGEGLVPRVKEFESWVRWCDFILMVDNNKYLHRMDQLRQSGVRIVGPSTAMAQWELDRVLGMKVLEKVGIPCPPYKEFSDYDAAINYVKKQDRAFVSKPCGDEPDKSLSYVAPSPEALVFMLQNWSRRGKIKSKFILQEKVKGIEFAVSGWFGPHGWNRGVEENWEFKRLLDGDLGPNTGESGTVMRWVKSSKLADKVLKPLTELLLQNRYIGNIDVNCIVDETGHPWPLEHTVRLGVPAFQIQQALTDGDHAEWLYDLCDGVDSQAMIYDQIAVGIVMTIPPYPNGRGTDDEVMGIPIMGITDRNRDAIHPSMIMMGEVPSRTEKGIGRGEGWVTAGDYVLCATGVADTVAAARNKALTVLDGLKDTPASPQFRRQIGNRLKTQLPILQALGFATNMDYADE